MNDPTDPWGLRRGWQIANGQPVAPIVLDPYEVANLREAIAAIYDDVGGPLGVLNSGDWLGQVLGKLPLTSDLRPFDREGRWRALVPNRSAQSYRDGARKIVTP